MGWTEGRCIKEATFDAEDLWELGRIARNWRRYDWSECLGLRGLAAVDGSPAGVSLSTTYPVFVSVQDQVLDSARCENFPLLFYPV